MICPENLEIQSFEFLFGQFVFVVLVQWLHFQSRNWQNQGQHQVRCFILMLLMDLVCQVIQFIFQVVNLVLVPVKFQLKVAIQVARPIVIAKTKAKLVIQNLQVALQ